MTINATDIKLLASERMADTSDGGGRRTSNVIPDGVPGNIFPKVSRLDSVYGRVNLRKIYGAVSTANIDTYAGAHAVIMDAPDNERIHAALFSTGSDFDDRTAARDRIESYVIAGPESRMVLYGRQLVGQSAILAYQKPEESLPEVGDVFCLSKESGATTIYQQYVRITDLTHEVRVLTDEKGDYSARVLTMAIGAPLRYEFAGPLVPARYSSTARESLVRLTSVADASRYFGIQKLTQSAQDGDLSLQLSSVYTQIVPTTQRETPLSNVDMLGASIVVDAASALSPRALVHSGLVTAGLTLRLPFAFRRGSLQVHLATGPANLPFVDYTDNGAGGSAKRYDTQFWHSHTPNAVSIDYDNGTFTFVGTPQLSAASAYILVSAIPAVSSVRPAHTLNTPITLATRGTVYALSMRPIPAPGSLAISYRALGKWYVLRDDGSGTLAGIDAAYGTGTIDYTSGAAVVTLGALPDVGSALISSWGSPVHVTPRDRVIVEPPVWRHRLPDTNIKPGTVTISWETRLRDVNGNVTSTLAQSVSDDGAGKLTGDGIGRIVYATGALWFLPSLLPDPGSTPVVDYQKQDYLEEAFTPTADGNGMLSMTLAGGNPVPGTVTLLWQTIRSKTVEEKAGTASGNVTYQVTGSSTPIRPVGDTLNRTTANI